MESNDHPIVRNMEATGHPDGCGPQPISGEVTFEIELCLFPEEPGIPASQRLALQRLGFRFCPDDARTSIPAIISMEVGDSDTIDEESLIEAARAMLAARIRRRSAAGIMECEEKSVEVELHTQECDDERDD